MGNWQDGCCDKPGQPHYRTYGQHHSNHQKIQMVPTAFLCRGNRVDTYIWSAHTYTHTSSVKPTLNNIHTKSLCSLRFIMTAVICWSMKMRMVQRRAGIGAASTVHHGFRPMGLINQPRSSRVGCKRQVEIQTTDQTPENSTAIILAP